MTETCVCGHDFSSHYYYDVDNLAKVKNACLIALNGLQCETLHPDLNLLIPKDLLPLPPDNLLHTNPIIYYNNNIIYNIIYIIV